MTFPSSLPFLDQKYVAALLETSLAQCSSAIIKNFETASLLLSLLFEHYLPLYYDSSEEKTLLQLRFLNELLGRLEERSARFAQSFLVDWPTFYANLPHGLCTALSALLQIFCKSQPPQGTSAMLLRLLTIMKSNMKYAV